MKFRADRRHAYGKIGNKRNVGSQFRSCFINKVAVLDILFGAHDPCPDAYLGLAKGFRDRAHHDQAHQGRQSPINTLEG